MKVQRMLNSASIAALLLALIGRGIHGQGLDPQDGTATFNEPAAVLNNVIPIQGRLTDENGALLNGAFEMRFAIYDAVSANYPLCSDTDTVGVDHGIFSANITCNSYDIDGRQLWLGVAVGSDVEMTPRRPIYAVPYAWTLRPGAEIINPGTTSDYAIGLYAESTATGGRGLYGRASSAAPGLHPVGVYGQADALQGTGVRGLATIGASSGYGGFFVNESATGDLIAANDQLSYSELEFRVSNDGEVYADGTYHSYGADFAELLPATVGLEPGDVLAIGPDGQLARSLEAYQPTVAGVYSTQPGFLGGTEEDKILSEVDLSQTGSVPLAIAGVAPVKASAENGAIRPGDLLVASSIPGHAMKAGPNPPTGTVVGKSLGSLEAGTGTIEILVMLQ
jgi:hypothetical protein